MNHPPDACSVLNFPPSAPIQIMREDPATVKVLLEHGANRWEKRTEHFPACLDLMD